MRSAGFLLLLAGCGASVPLPANSLLVTSDLKGGRHPYNSQGAGVGYMIDGQMGAELVLERGTTYIFSIETPHHPFYFSTDEKGGLGAPGRIEEGVVNDLIDVGTMTFTPGDSLPDTFFYQCALHDYMGWRVRLMPRQR